MPLGGAGRPGRRRRATRRRSGGCILDTSRRRPVDAGRGDRATLARRFADAGVVAVGLAGDEAYPAAPFAAVFADAREAGLHVVHHAGEAAGPASIREALAGGSRAARPRHPGPGRPGAGGRGPRAADPAGGLPVVQRGARLRAVVRGASVAAPARRGPASVTLNTDIPAMIGTTLTDRVRPRARTRSAGPDAELAAIAAGRRRRVRSPPTPLKATLRADITAWLSGGRSDASRSWLSRPIVVSGMPFGHTAVHSPVLVQPPKPGLVVRRDHVRRPRAARPAGPAAAGRGG